jgi:hypothetical protein
VTSRRQAAHEARRRAAREGPLTREARPPDVVVTCGRCTDGRGQPRFIERFRHDRSAARWVATAQTPEVELNADDRPTDGWTNGMAVRSVWVLQCPACGERVPARDGAMQVAAWRMVHGLTVDGQVPRKLPSVTLDELRVQLRATPEQLR